jgi:hypothetical protein
MGRFVSATGQFLLATYGQFSRPPTGSFSCPLTCNPADSLQPAIAHLRDVLGDQTYESLARQGERMSTTAIVTYAYDQIDQARAELKAVSK